MINAIDVTPRVRPRRGGLALGVSGTGVGLIKIRDLVEGTYESPWMMQQPLPEKPHFNPEYSGSFLPSKLRQGGTAEEPGGFCLNHLLNPPSYQTARSSSRRRSVTVPASAPSGKEDGCSTHADKIGKQVAQRIPTSLDFQQVRAKRNFLREPGFTKENTCFCSPGSLPLLPELAHLQSPFTALHTERGLSPLKRDNRMRS